VHACVRSVPSGFVTTYGDVARRTGLRTPRQVGHVLARSGGAVPWHRVVHADGTLVADLAAEQARRLRAEGVTVRRDRVDLAVFRW
jgi:methylated-DNA-protein-cysteine methyltransferase related protein